ncbi:hypothetical protein C8R44DRAFT_754888 [Mycena epipterygia]|nr:hypothetical protein C8R44DRAFT_754888 [Mycena epipterygia]
MSRPLALLFELILVTLHRVNVSKRGRALNSDIFGFICSWCALVLLRSLLIMPPKRSVPDDSPLDDDPWTTYRTGAVPPIVKFFDPATFQAATQEPLRQALAGIYASIVEFYDLLADTEERPLEVEQFNFQVGVIFRMALQRFPTIFKKAPGIAKLSDLCPKNRVMRATFGPDFSLPARPVVLANPFDDPDLAEPEDEEPPPTKRPKPTPKPAKRAARPVVEEGEDEEESVSAPTRVLRNTIKVVPAPATTKGKGKAPTRKPRKATRPEPSPELVRSTSVESETRSVRQHERFLDRNQELQDHHPASAKSPAPATQRIPRNLVIRSVLPADFNRGLQTLFACSNCATRGIDCIFFRWGLRCHSCEAGHITCNFNGTDVALMQTQERLGPIMSVSQPAFMGALYQLVQARRLCDLTYQLLHRHFQDLEQAASEAARFQDPTSIATLEAFFDRLEITREVALQRWEARHPEPEVQFLPRPAGSSLPADDPSLAYDEWIDFANMEYRSRYAPSVITEADDPERDDLTRLNPFGEDILRLVPPPTRGPAQRPGPAEASTSRPANAPPRLATTAPRTSTSAAPRAQVVSSTAPLGLVLAQWSALRTRVPATPPLSTLNTVWLNLPVVLPSPQRVLAPPRSTPSSHTRPSDSAPFSVTAPTWGTSTVGPHPPGPLQSTPARAADAPSTVAEVEAPRPYVPLSRQADLDYEHQWGVPPPQYTEAHAPEPAHPPISSIAASSSPGPSLSNPDWNMSGEPSQEDPFDVDPAPGPSTSGAREDAGGAPRSQNGRRFDGESGPGPQH